MTQSFCSKNREIKIFIFLSGFAPLRLCVKSDFKKVSFYKIRQIRIICILLFSLDCDNLIFDEQDFRCRLRRE